jgi:CelD/BcsL family acetyltransferase involved in cellulose biosynthesis
VEVPRFGRGIQIAAFSAMSALILEVITDAGRLGEFQAEWSVFASAASPATPFQRPEWLITWWSHFGSGELRVMVFRDDGRTVGVMPLFLHEWCGRRQLTLIGTGITDYLDPLFAPEYTGCIVDRIGSELAGWPDWDICYWQDLACNTPLASLGEIEPDTACSMILFDNPFEAFLASRSSDLKRNLRRYKEKAERIAPVEFDVINVADEDLVCALIELHRERWRRSGDPGMIEANGSEPFLRAIVPILADRGWLRFFLVRFDGRPAAILLALCDGTTMFSWLSAFDPQYDKFGFGRELLAQAIRHAHNEGCRRWNFLRGDEPYKFSWGAQPLEKRRVVIRR